MVRIGYKKRRKKNHLKEEKHQKKVHISHVRDEKPILKENLMNNLSS